MANVVRQDVIKLSFDSDMKGLDKATNALDGLKKSVSGIGKADGLDQLKTEANKTNDTLGKLGKGANETKKEVDKLGKANVGSLKDGLEKVDDKLTAIARKSATMAYSGLKKVAGISFKALAVGIGAVGTAIGASVKSYADYEQLVGGVETLFGANGAQSAKEYAKNVGKSLSEVKGEYKSLKAVEDTVLKNASSAYKTAGLSANNYMETITGFAASLNASLGGDTKKSAEYADMAVKDMADNANKMGTDIQFIQNAYQGFAKQNYTMLDNLKLGYGGTKTEMERLIKDASKLDKTVKAGDMSFSNQVKAIHAVQVKMGIYGTTAKEAEHTVSGSLNAMKASWQNLLTAMSSGKNIDKTMKQMISSVETFGDNIIPVIEKALEGAGTLIEKLAPKLAQKIPTLAKSIVPSLFKAAGTLVGSLANALISNAGSLANSAKQLALETIKAIYEGFTGKEMSGDAFATLKSKVNQAFSSIKKIISGAIQFGKKLMSYLAPVLSFIGNLALNVFSWIGDNINWLLPLVAGLTGAFLAYKAALVVVKAITTIVTTVQTIMGAVCGSASAAAAAGTTAVGTAASVSAPQILAFAAAIAAVGFAILAICVGFALLIQSSIALASAGWGAIAVFVGLIAVIALLTIGLAVLGPVLTAGAIGFVAFGAAVLMVGAGFALIGVGALLAASALSIIAVILPVITMYGLQGMAAMIALGAGLTIFAGGATLAGAAAIILGAGLLVVAATLLVIAVSLALITAMLTIMAALSTVLAINFLLIGTMMSLMASSSLILSASLVPLAAVFTAMTIPCLLFAATLTPLTAVFVALAAAALVFLVSVTGLLVIFTALTLMVSLLNVQFLLMTTMFSLIAMSSLALVTGLAPLPILFTTLIPFVLAFALAITPLTILFVALGASALIFAVSMTALTAVMTILTAMMLVFTANMLILSALLVTNTTMCMLFATSLTLLITSLTLLAASLLITTPALLLFTASLLPLAAVMTALIIPTVLFTATMAALMAVFVILGPMAMLFSTAMMMFSVCSLILSKTVPVFAEALEPLPKIFLKLIISAGLLAAALVPLTAEFVALSASAVILLAAITGLVATTAMLSMLFMSIVVASAILVSDFESIATASIRLAMLLIPLSVALRNMAEPLKMVSANFTKFALSLIATVAATAIINSSFVRMTTSLLLVISLLTMLLALLNKVRNEFMKIAKTPDVFSVAISNMTANSTSAMLRFISILTTTLSTAKALVRKISTDITNYIDKCISDIVSKISQLPIKMGDGIKNSGKSLSNAIVSIWKDAIKASVSPVNKVLDAANWILKEFGSEKRVATWTPYANGTNGHKGGNALVNDGKGAELVQMPNGYTFIPRGKNVLIPNAPKGMKVLPANQTAQLMGRKSATFSYADGVGDIDLFSYIDNAKGLISQIKSNISYDKASGVGLYMAKGMVETITAPMSSWFDKLVKEFGAVNYDASKGTEQWRPLVIRALKMTGQYSLANVLRTLYQMQTESGGNPKAINLWDSNAKKGIPSKGLMQVIDPTFQSYAMPGFNKNVYDPLSNILASIRYAVSRYGSLERAFQGHGYANGGIARKPSIFGEDGAEMAIPLSANKRKRGLNLWAKTGSMLGVSSYSPESDYSSYPVSSVEENTTYAPVFNLTISGTSDDRAMARKIKGWIAEALNDNFESMSRKTERVQEI